MGLSLVWKLRSDRSAFVVCWSGSIIRRFEPIMTAATAHPWAMIPLKKLRRMGSGSAIAILKIEFATGVQFLWDAVMQIFRLCCAYCMKGATPGDLRCRSREV